VLMLLVLQVQPKANHAPRAVSRVAAGAVEGPRVPDDNVARRASQLHDTHRHARIKKHSSSRSVNRPMPAQTNSTPPLGCCSAHLRH